MKIIIILIILIIWSPNCFTQIKVIQFFDGQDFIPSVTVFDSSKNLFLISNEKGEIYLKNQNYLLVISHVGYNSSTYHISSEDNQTLIKITLSKRIHEELPVLIFSKKVKDSKRLYKFGEINKNAKSGLQFYSQGKLGSVIEYDSIKTALYLKSLKFEIKNHKISNRYNSKLEIKIYQFERPFITPFPINSIPIIIDFKDLRRINEIIMKEKIVLPPNGILISFEFFNENTLDPNTYILFNGKENSDKCLTIKGSIFLLNWKQRVPIDCSFNPFSFKNIRLNLLIKCSNYYE